MPTCCVKSCKNRGNIPGVSYHKIPFRLREEWHKILNVHGMKTFSIHNAVCSDHFWPEDLDRDGFRVVLRKGVVPVLYLDKPKPEINRDRKRKTPARKMPTVSSKYIMISNDECFKKSRTKRRKYHSGNDIGATGPQLQYDEDGNLSWFSKNDVKIIDIGTILAKENTA